MAAPQTIGTIPSAIRPELQRRGCRVPQYARGVDVKVNVNVVWGEFDHRGQRDLVVMCATGKLARLLVFWDGDARRAETLPFGGVGSDVTLGSAKSVDHHAAPGARLTRDGPRVLDHDVIEVACCECCSTNYYLHRGVWFAAAGAD